VREFSKVGFARQTGDPSDHEVCDMIDDVIWQTLGAEGLRKIIRPGDRVVLKVNLVGPYMGERGEKGRGIITDPRVTRYVAKLVREIIGFGNDASLKVVDATMYSDPNPSLKMAKSSFYWAKLERTGDNSVDEEDFCYDFDADGILDGGSEAELVNLDSIGPDGRQLFNVTLSDGQTASVSFPKFLRTKEQAKKSKNPEEYCDVLIALPIFKSHGIEGVTGALKLHYGIRSMFGMPGDPGRYGHNGMYYDEKGNHNVEKLTQYLCAQHLVRSYDFCIMDCITANRKGPTLPVGGIAYNPDHDQKADYIITSAMMASLDPVALDTAEAALAGYEPSSIRLPSLAAQNSLGISDPAWIHVVGKNLFSLHRQFLWRTHNQNRQRKYPLEDGWGGAKALKSVSPQYSVEAGKAKKIDENVYHIDYRIKKDESCKHRQIVRVELIIEGAVLEFDTNDFEGRKCIEQGHFVLDLKKYKHLLNTDLGYNIYAWDDILNCVPSMERFIFASK